MIFSHNLVVVDTCKHYTQGIAGVLTKNILANTVIPAVVEPRDLALDNSLLQRTWATPPPDNIYHRAKHS